ncbi:hypothetical protein [Rhizobium ruizarguesonis]|uniref:hypothetical protein n=1 Tax=Rhizobium ruizarguesonis TaxID=2081791 RepID=UPI001A8FAB7D|nr:hypothetical protein [Rhizobium ruizarguesonis]
MTGANFVITAEVEISSGLPAVFTGRTLRFRDDTDRGDRHFADAAAAGRLEALQKYFDAWKDITVSTDFPQQ